MKKTNKQKPSLKDRSKKLIRKATKLTIMISINEKSKDMEKFKTEISKYRSKFESTCNNWHNWLMKQ